jgi:hypothetical protein
MQDRDFTGNNLVMSLLQERRQLKERLKRDTKRLKAINDKLKEAMEDAITASLPGWRLEIKIQNRKEYVIPAQVWKLLFVYDDDEEELPVSRFLAPGE